ncbi:MAG: adenine phosphoribosyltransferase [Cytophagaceae bacterium]
MQSLIREIPDFPKKGIAFKDITPMLMDQKLTKQIVKGFVRNFEGKKVDAVACLESRGFWYGMSIAQQFKVPFIPIRKAGKLPGTLVSCTYDLEYGTACVEMHADAIKKNWNVLIHDDVLATGGTAAAAAELIKAVGGKVAGFAFLLELSQLNGQSKISPFSKKIISLVTY